MYSTDTIAAELVARTGRTSVSRIHRLLYLTQGQYLAKNGCLLFEGHLSAYPNGPVSVEFYEQHRGSFTVDPSELPTSPRESVSADVAAFLDGVVATYGTFDSAALAAHGRNSTPWRNGRQRADRAITTADLYAWFAEHEAERVT